MLTYIFWHLVDQLEAVAASTPLAPAAAADEPATTKATLAEDAPAIAAAEVPATTEVADSAETKA